MSILILQLKGLGTIARELGGFKNIKEISSVVGGLKSFTVESVAARIATTSLSEAQKIAAIQNTILAATGKTVTAIQAEEALAAATAATSTATAGAAAAGASAGFTGLAASAKAAGAGLATFFLTNPVGWAILAGVAIAGVAKLVDTLTETFEEAQEKSAESREAYQQTTSEVEQLNSELETTQSRINELKAQGSLSVVEKAELAELQAQNEQLQRQIEIKEKLANMQGKQAAKDANNVLTKPTQSVTEWIDDKFDQDWDTSNDARDIITRTEEKQRQLNQYKSDRDKLYEEQSKLTPEYSNWWESDTQYEKNQRQLENYEKQIDTLEKEIAENIDSINTEYNSLLDSNGDAISGYEDTVQRCNDLFDYTLSSSDKALQVSEKIDSIFNKPTLSNFKDELVDIAANSDNVGITADDVKTKYSELADACEDAGVDIQDLVDYINSTADIIDVDEVKSQLSEAFDVSDEQADFDSFLDSLSVDDLKILYSIHESNDTSGWNIEDFQQAMDDLQLNDITVNIEANIKNTQEISSEIKNLQSVLSSQATGNSISIDTFNSDELKDYQSALEYVNGSMQLNADKAREIAKAKVEEQTAINNTNKELRQAQYMQNINQIEDLKRKLADKNNLTEEEILDMQRQIAECETQNAGYLAECDQLDILNASLKESISTYNDWKAAQGASESGDMFDDTLTAIKNINDTLNDASSESYGRIGRKDFQASIDLIIPESVDSEDKQAVNNYMDSIKNLFTFDNDGKMNGLNLEEFCKKAVDEGLMVLDEASDEYMVAGGKTMADFANGMNLSMPLVQAMFGELEEFGAEFDWGDEMFATFGDGIIAAQTQISELETEIESLEEQKAAGIDIDDSQIDEAKNKLEELKRKKDELTEKATVNIEANIDLDEKIQKAQDKVTVLETKLKSGDLSGQLELKYTSDLEAAQGKLDKLKAKKDKLQEPTQVEIQAAFGDIDSQIAGLNSKIQAIKDDQVSIHPTLNSSEANAEIANLNGQIQSLQDKKAKIEAYAETKNANSDLDSLDKKEISNKDFTVSAIDNATTVINRINNLQLQDKSVTITTTQRTIKKTEGDQKLNGSAHMSGTAKASGDWRDKRGGETLVGELGREIIVNPHTGKWYTVGDNGAEFVNIPKNAIVFNHKQTEDLLSHGFVASRALAFAKGTALVSGNAMVSGGKISSELLNTLSNRTGYNSYSHSPSTSDIDKNTASVQKNTQAHKENTASYSDNTTAKENEEKEEKTALEKFQNWIGKLFDWIEVKVDRLQAKVDKTVDKAGQDFEAKKYKKAERGYEKAIKQTQKLINANRQGAERYRQQADKVSKKAVSSGLVSSGEMQEIQKLVKNGTIDIRKYSDEQQEVIKDYKDMYDKSKNCSNSIRELNSNIKEYNASIRESIREYYNAIYNAPIDKATKKIEKLSSKLELLSAKTDAVSGGSRVYDKVALQDAKANVESSKKDLKTEKAERTKASKQLKKTAKIARSTEGVTSGQAKAIKERKKVSTKGLSGQVLKVINAYNKALSEYNSANDDVSNAQKILEDAKNQKKNTKKQQRKNKNAPDYKTANKLLDQQTKIAKQENQANQKALREANKNLVEAQANQKKVSKKSGQTISKKSEKLLHNKQLTESQKQAVQNGKKIDTTNLTGKALKNANAYNNAVKKQKEYTTALKIAQEAQNDAVKNATISQAEYTKILQENTKAKLDNVDSYYESKQGINSATQGKLSAKIEYRKNIGKNVTSSDYQELISVAKNDVTIAKNRLDNYIAQYDSAKRTLSDKDNKAALEHIQELEQAWYDAKNAVIDYKAEAIQTDIDNVRNDLDWLESYGDLLKDAYDKNQNINQQIDLTRREYDLMIEQETNYIKKAALREQKEKAIRDLLQSQLDNIKEQDSYYSDWYSSQATLKQAEQDAFVAWGRDSSRSKYETALYNRSAQENIANVHKTNAVDLYNQIHGSEYGYWSGNEFIVWNHMFEQYTKAMADYRNMMADCYKAEAEAAREGYNAWVAWYLEPKQQAFHDLQTAAELANAQIAVMNEKGLSTTDMQYMNLISNSKSQEDNLRYQNSLLQSYQSMYDSGSTKYRELQEQIDNNNKTIYECQKNQIEWNNAIVQIPFNEIEKALEKLDAIKSNYESMLSVRSARGISQTVMEYKNQISQAYDEIAQYSREQALALGNYWSARNNYEGVYGGKTADEWYTEYMKYGTSINNLQKEIEEYNNAIVQIPFDDIEKSLDKLNSIASNRKARIDLKSALGQDLSSSDYFEQMNDNNDKISKYYQESVQAYNNYLTALSNQDKVYGGKSADEWLGQYYDFDTQINQLKKDNEDLKDALRDDVYWRTYERSHDAAKRYADIVSGIKSLISDDMYFDADGNLTKWGVTQVANIISQYETARDEVQNYSNDIKNLNSLYTQGYYTQDEYVGKLNEIQTSMLDAASNMKAYINEIIDMYKQFSQTELDNLLKLIDLRNDALSKKKAYYDYDKSLKDKNKNIQLLQAEIAALDGVATAEAKAKRAKLEAELSESKDELNDTINQHIFDLSQDALNELKSTLQDAFDDKWDNINSNLDEVTNLMAAANQLTASSTASVIDSMNQLLKHYGIDPVSSGISAAYASGTRNVPKDQIALTNENGNEILVTKKGMITPLEHGDGVLPSYLTNNLYDLALNGVPTPNFVTPEINVKVEQPDANKVGIHIDKIENTVEVQGNTDAATIERLKKATDDIVHKSYEYTSKKIYGGYMRSGGKRNV